MMPALSTGGERERTFLRWIESSGDERSEGAPKFSLSPGVRGSANVKPTANNAFTLIELMVVIVLIGILSVLIIPELKGGYQDALLRSTSRNLVNVFSIASSRAVSLNQLHRVRLDAKTGHYVIEKRTRETVQGDEFAPLKDVSEAEGTLDTRISIQVRKPEALTAAGPETTTPNESAGKGQSIDSISFYSDGTADSAEMVLRDQQGFRLALRINPITSRVKVLELEHE